MLLTAKNLNAKPSLLFFLTLILGFGIGNIALATCYQGATDPYLKEKCYHVESGRWYEDYCKDENTVVEYKCSGGNCTPVEYNCNNDCLPGYEKYCFCSGGRCVKKRYCRESDRHKDIYDPGYCEEFEGKTSVGRYDDGCNGSVLREYFCKNDGSCGFIDIDCSSSFFRRGGSCSSGECTQNPQLGSCYDSDDGIKAGIPGKCVDGYGAGNQDSCNGDDLTEWYCESTLDRCVPKIIHCDNCTGGKCLGAAPVIEPPKPQGPNQCCLLNHKLTDVDPACDKGVVVGPSDARWCDVNRDGERDTIDAETVKWGTCCFLDSLYNVSDWIFIIFFPLAVVVFGVAGALFVFSGGEPEV